jgi:RNA polymerase sigma-70 factor (ECF subfamily)
LHLINSIETDLNNSTKLNLSESELIKACINKESFAERVLYDKYKGRLFTICLRYFKNKEEAEDVFTNGFVRIFSKLNSYSGKGSFEGWMKKIMVNECLMEIRKSVDFKNFIEIEEIPLAAPETILSELGVQEIMKLIHELPLQQRTVFNLYVFEDYSHEEIAKEMGISIGGSKSQLSRARKKLQDLIISHG